jgi:hypothetical protein
VSQIIESEILPISEEVPSHYRVYELLFPLNKDGTFNTLDAKAKSFSARSKGWSVNQFGLVHREIILPIEIVNEYISNFKTASKYFNKSLDFENMSTHNLKDKFRNLGFSRTGKIIKQNGVTESKHELLLDKIASFFPIKTENKEALDAIHQNAVYDFLSTKEESESNPNGLLYSKKEHNAIIKEFTEKILKKYCDMADVAVKRVLAIGGIKHSMKQTNANMQILDNKKGLVEHFMNTLGFRRNNKASFDTEIDFSLFQREHPIGTIKADDKQLLTHYLMQNQRDMVCYAVIINKLFVKKYRAGLKRILSE